MSFAWGWLIGSGLAAGVALALRPHFWMFKPSLVNWRGMTSFGGYNGVVAILYGIFDALPLLLLGRLVSPHTAALFSRTLLIGHIPDKLVLGGAMTVVLPAFSAEVRQGRDLKGPYLAALSLVTALRWPALLVLSVLAYPVVVVLSHQWIEVAPLVQVVAVALLFSFSFELNYPVMVAVDATCLSRTDRLPAFRHSPVHSRDLRRTAGGRLVHAGDLPFQAYVALSFVRRRLGLRRRDIAAALWRSAVVAMASAAAPLSVIALSGSGFALLFGQAFGAGLFALSGWATALILTRHPLFDEIMKTIPVFRRAKLRPGE